jgi:rhamnulokinase
VTRAPVRVLAVDLGATSVRVVAVDLAAPEPAARVLHRWRHQPVRHQDGSLRWDWHGILREVARGLELGLAAGPVASIGVDGWGVDYGLLDGRGALLSPPYCYRDERTEGWRTTAERIGAEHLYAVTGIQLLHLNTIFQLAAHDRTELRRAARLLLLPDLVVRMLTGFEGAERSNASTTALLDAQTGDWSAELLEAVGLDPALLPPIVSAGLAVGSWRGVGVHTVGSHDTASAFVGVPGAPGPGSVVVSSGTWVLVGAERPTADTSQKARDANFSNEAGALGGVRFLKNVTGFWLSSSAAPHGATRPSKSWSRPRPACGGRSGPWIPPMPASWRPPRWRLRSAPRQGSAPRPPVPRWCAASSSPSPRRPPGSLTSSSRSPAPRSTSCSSWGVPPASAS